MDLVHNETAYIKPDQPEFDFYLRSLLYLIKPSETFYAETKDVPNITNKATSILFILVFVEQILHLIKDGKFNGKISDGVASMTAGIFLLMPK